MAATIVPTKSNLISAKKSLVLARLGYDLLDRKHNILIREMMALMIKAKSLRGENEFTFRQAYEALQKANITMGIIDDISKATQIENGITITYRSVMGVDIPEVSFESSIKESQYGLFNTNSQFDIAYLNFNKAKDLAFVLAEVENSVYRLADAIKKTKRRSNALRNVNLPRFTSTVKYITDALEEKDREEFTRLKVIKRNKDKDKKEES